MALTSKKQRFADARLAGLSNKEAAIKAGYSAATASPAGSRLVKDPDVVEYLKRKRQAAAKAAKSGAPPASQPQTAADAADPIKFLEGVMAGRIEANVTQVRAAMALLPFKHPKLGEGGKKEQRQDAAKKVAGRFSAAAPPKLVATGGKKV